MCTDYSLKRAEEKEHAGGGGTHLPKAGGVDRLGVVLLAEVQVVHVEGAARNADPLRDLVVLLQPGGTHGRPVSKSAPSKTVTVFLVLQSLARPQR